MYNKYYKKIITCLSNQITYFSVNSQITELTPQTTTNLDKALEELNDPLLPIKGHGLISLARMVEDRNEEVKSKEDLLMKVSIEKIIFTMFKLALFKNLDDDT